MLDLGVHPATYETLKDFHNFIPPCNYRRFRFLPKFCCFLTSLLSDNNHPPYEQNQHEPVNNRSVHYAYLLFGFDHSPHQAVCVMNNELVIRMLYKIHIADSWMVERL